MGIYSVGEAIVQLQLAGIRAQRAFPGTLMPHLTGAVAAVTIHKDEPEKTTLVAYVCAPMHLGVHACENLSKRVAQVWTEAGGACSYGEHRFDGQSGLYEMSVYGTWTEPEE